MTALETLVMHYATPLLPDIEGVYYFASPYTADDPTQTQEWVQEMRDLKPRIINAYPRIVPLVPVLETDPLAGHCEPEGGWYAFGLTLLDTAEGIIIVQQDDWQHSRGIMLELGFARAKGLPIATLEPNRLFDKSGVADDTEVEPTLATATEFEHGRSEVSNRMRNKRRTTSYTESDILEQMETLKKADPGYANWSPDKLRAKAIEILEDDIPF